ncbi:hypothetical protein [Leptolyngbya sp. NIES-2104]|uniref:hypothetical protein n=1 Tax=Leptolyngbya sp. NIES-2104 TaxID=1552121 RepID=UPI0006ECC27A|nr:hypothetical protein [Leptolyngbya sp. NIES-2104]GAP99485.1 putative secreted protein [Leptolyngbya sp. NIES-2104]
MTVHHNATIEIQRLAYYIEFESKPIHIQAGEPVELAFTIRNSNGEIAQDLKIVHEQAIHLLVVSEDLSEFYHLHPEQEAEGRFRLVYTFPQAGQYRLYADYTPINSDQIVDQLNLHIAGEARAAIALIEDDILTKSVNGLRFTLTANQPLRAGEAIMLDFAVEDEQTHQPVTDLQPYLGALAHFVIISEDGSEFLHVHPMDHHEPSISSHADSSTDHASHSSTSQISAHTRFPRAGLYKIWAQFQRRGQVITVPFVVRVAE